ncbi:MAG: class I SAM-dependent methyltransferase, partial [Candidatus Eiseniibacteriota bacterium]
MNSDEANRHKWYESEEFWMVTYPEMFSEERWNTAPAEVSQIVALLGLRGSAKVLDLSCGPGRHAIELAVRGFRVTGVDSSTFLLTKAKERAREKGVAVELIINDVRSFTRPDAFDAAISIYSSFGYFEDQNEDRLVAERIYASLRPGGKVMIDLIGREVLKRSFAPHSHSEGNGILVEIDRNVNADLSWIENHQTIVAAGKTHKFNMQHRIYSEEELRALLQGVGFRDLQTHGNLAGAPYDDSANRLVIIGHKSTSVPSA